MVNIEDKLGDKKQLHVRNKHRSLYDFEKLVISCPELQSHLSENTYGSLSVNFQDPVAVKLLNRALLKHFYGVDLWDIPEGYLCPPIPGRADYIHYLADLLSSERGKGPGGKSVRILDIGVGANCIYPLLGNKEYHWTFVGSDIDHLAIRSAKNIIEANNLTKSISIRKQSSSNQIFEGVINHGENFDATMCNPPFHSSDQKSRAGTVRKWKNLGRSDSGPLLNFGGKGTELWCEGGEVQFVSQMVKESESFANSVSWFTSLISRKESLPVYYRELEKANATDVRTIQMSQGQKVSRILAWTFKG